MIWEIIIGLLPAAPAYLITSKILLKKKPVVYKTRPSSLTPILEQYRQRQLEIEGKVAPAAIEQKQSENKEKVQSAETVLERNYAKWANNKAEIPLVMESVKVLQTLSSMSALKLSTEERHNLEVLSGQMEELLTNFFNTPEAIRNLPEVERALWDQLTQIEAGVTNVKTSGAENLIQNLRVGTEFIRTKFNSKGRL